MNDAVIGRGTDGNPLLSALVWAAGAGITASAIVSVLAAVGVGFGMFVVVTLDLGRGPGTAVYLAMMAVVVLAFAAVVHFGLGLMERSVRVPGAVWLGMAAYPAAMWAVELFDSADRFEPVFGTMAALGLVIAWTTTRWQRARQTSPSRSASNAPER